MSEYNIRLALKNVSENSGVNISMEEVDMKHPQIANLNGNRFAILYRNAITTQNIVKTCDLVSEMKMEYNMPVLVVTGDISANVMSGLFRDGISVAETSGNCRIANGETFISVSGCKKIGVERNQQTYTATKLKVIFYFLLAKENISHPYRYISENTGTSLSVIKQTVDDLVHKKYVILTPKGRILKNRKGLVKLWGLYYNEVMKPQLLLAKFDFINSEARAEWEEMLLPEGMTWGGEPAAFLIDGYLKPELFEIYSSEVVNKLLTTGKFKPNPEGKISVYNKFWHGFNSNHAPNVLVYADLIGIGESRCEEAAQRLLDKIKDW